MKNQAPKDPLEQGFTEVLQALEGYSIEDVHVVLSAMSGIGSIADFDATQETIFRLINNILAQYPEDKARSIRLFLMTHYNTLMNN